MAVLAPTSKRFRSKSTCASKPLEDSDGSAHRGSTRLSMSSPGMSSPASTRLSVSSRGTRSSVSSSASFLSRISCTFQSSSHDVEKPKDRRKSGLMVALAFDGNANMQSYLRKSHSFALRQAQVSEVEEEEICVWSVKSVSQVSQSVENCSRKFVPGWRQPDDSVLSCFTCFAFVELFWETAPMNYFLQVLAFSFFPRKLTAWFRMNTSHQKYMRTLPEQPGMYSKPRRCFLSKKVLCRSNFFQEFKV